MIPSLHASAAKTAAMSVCVERMSQPAMEYPVQAHTPGSFRLLHNAVDMM